MSTTIEPIEWIESAASTAAFERAADAILTLDDRRRDELRLSLEREARAEPPPRREPGVWKISRDASGEVRWDVRSGVPLRERHSWKAVPLSSRKGVGVKRVVLLGSSSAASFGYCETFSLAHAIERKLNAAAGTERFEVIDLACVNALWTHGTDMLRQAASLDPDVAIFYCGNNEAKSLLGRLQAGQLRGLPSAADATFSETFAMPERSALLHRCLEELVDALATQTVEEARRLGMDVAFLIPEYNLRDWQGLERIPVHLSGPSLQEWGTAVTAGKDALTRGDASEALQQFDRAIALDGAFCQRPLFGRARALTALGAPAREQTHAYTAARDAGIGLFLRGTPQVTQGVIETLRTRLDALNAPYVDLPELLAGAAGDGGVGRAFFLDYCHLTAEGIDLAATELARVVFERATGGAADDAQRAALQSAVRPEPREEALACWVAAIHNHHYGQSREIIGYWLRRALETWPPIERLCRFLADALCTPFRERFTVEAFRREGLIDLMGERHFFFFAKFFYHARFDHALASLIDELTTGPDEGALVRRTAGSLRALDGNLYSLFFMDMRNGFVTSDRTAPRGGWERPCLDLDASEPESLIEFPADGGEEARLLLELSGPPDAGGSCTVALNGREILSCAVTGDWRRHAATIAAGVLRPGLNELRFRWSHLAGVADRDLPAHRRRYVAQFGHYPVAARIHRLKISRPETESPAC
jgi:hypothetical protein